MSGAAGLLGALCNGSWIAPSPIAGVTRRLTKTEATHLIGNSVPKRMARLLAEANAAHALTIPQKARAA
jgi:hypothetical protein